MNNKRVKKTKLQLRNIVFPMLFGRSSTYKLILRSLKTGFGKLLGEDFQEVLLLCVQETRVFLACLFSLMSSVMCRFCLCDFISNKQQQINGKNNHSSVHLNLSSETFYMCPDKCTTTLLLHRGRDASDGVFFLFS